VLPEHYPVVRDAMLAALAEALGPEWTIDLRTDWHRLLEKLSNVMLSGTLPRKI
jgi:hemoglobin-like flavoprotein